MKQPLRLLLITADDIWADTVQRLFGARGYAVTRARNARVALEEGLRERPDAVLIERETVDSSRAELCRSIRAAPGVDVTMPIVVTTVNSLSADQRLELLRAGAWDLVQRPLDPDEMLARVENYLAARRAAERAREEGLIDTSTGLYNTLGLSRRCEELVADAFRRHAALACLAVAPELKSPVARREPEAVSLDLARALHGVRRSDVTGRQTPVEYVILAPRTDALGAMGLARRISGSVRGFDLRVGYDAVPNVREVPTSAAALIHAALEALHRASLGTGHSPIQQFRRFEHRRPDLV
jgi:DNA-binding response OmpR family regulator